MANKMKFTRKMLKFQKSVPLRSKTVRVIQIFLNLESDLECVISIMIITISMQIVYSDIINFDVLYCIVLYYEALY